MYIERSLKNEILTASKQFKVLLLTGPRQIGKTTVLEKLQGSQRGYISLDGLDTRIAAKEDPEGFIKRLKLPIIIDEVQYAPELFPYIKMVVDQRKEERGLFWLTGSQQFSMMKDISESLAGRVAILNMQGISLAEEEGRPDTAAFIPTIECLSKRRDICKPLSIKELFFKIWRGSYPDVISMRGENWQRFYESYVTTYVERDVRDYLRIDNLVLFRKFLQIAASRTAQIINYNDISKELGISVPTVKNWFSVLEATGIIRFLQPYYNNLGKRILKTPKFYFMDSGLCCYLTKWLNPDVLENGAMAGAMLETYVVSEIIKSYIHNGITPPLYYYTDKDKREVDILIEQNGTIYPIEIKKASSIKNSMFKGFDFLEVLKMPIGNGCVLCTSNEWLPYRKNIDIVPIGYL